MWMKKFKMVSCVFIVLTFITVLQANDFEVSQTPRFPVRVGNEFTLTLQPKSYLTQYDPASVLSISINGKEVVKYLVGLNRHTPSQNITVNMLANLVIQVKINFTRDDYMKPLQVSWAPTFEQMLSPMIAYSSIIELFEEAKFVAMDLSGTVTDATEPGFMANARGQLSCHSDGSLPPQRLELINPDYLGMPTLNYDGDTRLTVSFEADKKAHGQMVGCRLGQVTNMTRLVVFHPVSSVQIKPSSSEVVVGSTVQCIADGYPLPTYKWTSRSSGLTPPTVDPAAPVPDQQQAAVSSSVSGFVIDGAYLTPLLNATLGTEYVFSCEASNTLPGASTPVSFTTEYRFTLTLVAKGNLGIVVGICLGILFFALIAIAAFVLLKRCHGDGSKFNGTPTAPRQQYEAVSMQGSSRGATAVAGRYYDTGPEGPVARYDGEADKGEEDDSMPQPTSLEYAELAFDDKPPSRKPIKVIDDTTDYAEIVAVMQPKNAQQHREYV